MSSKNETKKQQDAVPTTQQTNGSAQAGRQRNQSAALMPAVDVFENKDGITLVADMPGVSKDKLELQVEADTLTIEGEVSLDLPEGMEANYADVGLSRYRRVFTLSKELDAEKVSADLKNGVLTLRIPKAAHAQPRRIAVQAA